MSFFDKRKQSKKLQSTRQLMEVSSVKDDSLHLFNGKIKIAIIIQPTNLCVLSDNIINSKIIALTNVQKAVPNIEMLCVNSTQNYDNNIQYLIDRHEAETNPVLKNLLLKEIDFLKDIRVNMATNREFFLLATFNRGTSNETIRNSVNRIIQQLTDGNFVVRIAQEEDYKRILTIYYDNALNEDYSDYDGLKYLEQEDN